MSHRRGTNPTTLLLLWITLALAAHGCAHDPVPVFTIPTPPPDAATPTGIVVSDDGPVPFANVIVRETRRGAQTDEKGRFAITIVAPGQGVLVVNAIGYSPKTVPINVEAGKVLDMGRLDVGKKKKVNWIEN